MGRLAQRRAHDALQAIGAVADAAADPGSFGRAGVRALPALVGADLATLSTCALDSGRREVIGYPDRALCAADIACFDRFFFAHPLVRFHAANPAGGSHRISDSLPASVFRRTALYAEYYRSIRIEHVVAIPLYVDARTLVSFVLNRSGRDFDDDDVAALDAVRVPLAALYRRARAAQRARTTVARFRAWVTAEGWHEIGVAADLTVRHGSRGALALLGAAVAGPAVRPGDRLPGDFAPWLRHVGNGAPAGAGRTIARDGREFTLRALPAAEGDGWLVYVREPGGATALTAPGAAADAVPLSRREREVLDWVAAGKTDAQAAAILGISVRTVQKHLENSYVKLGVEGRTAAVMRVRAAGNPPCR